ncbi:hypothetical protein ACQ7B2_03775, partial [Escherichia coli]
NLLALHELDALGVRADSLGFLGLLWPAATCSWLVTVVALLLVFRRSLSGRYEAPVRPPVAHRGLLVLGLVVCALLGPALLLGVS